MFPLRNQDGDTLLDLVFRITFYFKNSYKKEIRHNVLQATREFIDLMEGDFTYQATPFTRKWVKFNPSSVDKLGKYIENLQNDKSMSFGFYKQFGDPNAAPRTQISTIFNYKWQEDLGTYQSYISFVFPFSWFSVPGRPHPRDLMRRWAGLVGARHGWAGVGFNYAINQWDQRFSEMIQFSLALIWPTLLLEEPLTDNDYLMDCTREPGWLTAVGDEFLPRLGGKEALRQRLALTPGVEMVDYPGGVIIQAGAEPDPVMLRIFDPAAAWLTDPGVPMPDRPWDDLCRPIPDTVGPADYPELVATAAALKPIRVERMGAQGQLHVGSYGPYPFEKGQYLDAERTKAWVDRFDIPSPWDAYRIKRDSDIDRMRNTIDARGPTGLIWR